MEKEISMCWNKQKFSVQGTALMTTLDRPTGAAPMTNNHLRVNTLLGFDSYGTQMVTDQHTDMLALDGLKTLLAYAIIDPEREETSQWYINHGDVRNLSPTGPMLAAIHARCKSRDPEESMQRTYAAIGEVLTNEISQTQGMYMPHGNIVVSSDFVKLYRIAPALRTMKQHLPQHTIVVNTAIPERDEFELEEQQQHIQAILRLLHELKQQGILAATILTDLKSRVHDEVGKMPRSRLVAQSIDALLVAQHHSLYNGTFSEMMKRAGRLSPFVGLAIGTAKIASGEPKHTWGWLRSTSSSGSGDLNDAIAQAKRLTHEVLEDERLLVSSYAVDLTQPHFVAYQITFPPASTQFQEFENVLSAYLGQVSPKGSCLVVGSRGESVHNGLGPGLYCQVSAFYPLQPHLFTQLGYGAMQIGEGAEKP
jgi:hypothetical protein